MAAAAPQPGGPNVRGLVDGIQALLDAVETLRQAGVKAELPPELVAACRDLVAADDDPSRPRRRGRASHVDLSAIPLRRLVWKVMTPGETTTVTQVTDGLADLGVMVPATKVSNALGYWVAREELLRRSKGVYYYPLPGDGAPGTAADGPANPGRLPADRDTRPRARGRDKEHLDGTTTGNEEGTRRAG